MKRALLIFLLSPLALIAACGGSGNNSYNQQQVQHTIARQMYKQDGGFTVKVQCPSNPPINSYPASFKCVVSEQNYSPNNPTTIATVTIQDSNGDWVWQTG